MKFGLVADNAASHALPGVGKTLHSKIWKFLVQLCPTQMAY